MRIGIDCRIILNTEGVGRGAGVAHYTYFLVKNLLKVDSENKYVLFFDNRVKDTTEFASANCEIHFFPFYQYKRYLPFAYSHLLIAALLERAKLDVYHAPANVVPLKYSGKSVMTVHDLAIYEHPEWFPSKLLSREIFSTKILVPKSAERAQKIIAVSHYTKRDLKRLLNIPGEKIEVIHEGVDIGPEPSAEEIFRVGEKFHLPPKYILFISTIEPRKNILGLIEAFNEFITQEAFKDYHLVIAGSKGWRNKKIFEAIDQNKKIDYLGYVPSEDKAALIKGASCFVYPSWYEGFGLPVLEAMSLGVPVITSRAASLPEVVGQAAILVDPNKTHDLSASLAWVLSDGLQAERMRQAGLARAREFNWENCARQTLEVYKKCC